MLKGSVLVVLLYLGIFVALCECGGVQPHNTTIEDDEPRPVYTENTLPKLEQGCSFVFYCQKKLLEVSGERPCLKMCVKHLLCNNTKRAIARGHCLTFDEATVLKEYHDLESSGKYPGLIVAMIDFPCQPGYLPDNRGRCREVW